MEHWPCVYCADACWSRCLSCLQVFVTQQYLAIAMEYAAGGDMFEHVVRKGGLKESEARWFFQQLLVGVDYVHRMVCLPSFYGCSAGIFAHNQADRAALCILNSGQGRMHI